MTEQRPLLLAANHISWADILVIGSLFDVSFIATSDLAGWPIIGFLSKLQHTVFIERERKRKSGEQASEIARRLAAGPADGAVCRRHDGDGNMILPFKSSLFGAAGMAIDEHTADKVFIQPVAIAYTRVNGMPMGRQHRALVSWIGDAKGSWPTSSVSCREGAVDVELHFGEPIEFNAASKRKDVARWSSPGRRDDAGMFADPLRRAATCAGRKPSFPAKIV